MDTHVDDRLVGQMISHYEILERIGEGGMGVVYKAIDTRLARTVALKFLSPHLRADEAATKRFIREAKTASTVDHTNICTIYDIDRAEDGRIFIAMAYLDGESLKDKIARGRIPLDTAVNYAVQIARGLARAHQRGITHRDIKPANVVITADGVVKLVDFGLAKLAGDSQITHAGSVLGTTAYMAPEQLTGAAADHRSDIWSLGVVLYEMLAGKKPFEGDYHAAVMYLILHAEPDPLGRIAPGVSSQIERVVKRALQKNPTARYPDALRLLQDLEASSSTSIVGRQDRKTSFLVLPFQDMSPNRDASYLSDGVAEELISSLSEIRALRVICRTSAWQAKASGKDVGTLRQELDVDYLLDGSVRKIGDRIRITSQLIDTQTQSSVFTTRFDGTLDDIFEIQEKVARSVIEELRVTMTQQENERLSQREIDDVSVYDCYLRARGEMQRYTEDSLERALLYLQNGLEIIGDNVLLYAGIGYAHWSYANLGVDRERHIAEAEDFAERALAMAPDRPHGHRLRGLIAILEGDQRRAIRELNTAISLDERDPETLIFLTNLLGYVGKTAEARPLPKRLVAIDPLNPVSHGSQGWLDFLDGRFNRARQSYKKMYEMDPENPAYLFYYSHILACLNERDEAFALIDRMVTIAPDHPYSALCRFFRNALRGEKEDAVAELTPELRAICGMDLGYAWLVAESYALIGEKEESLDWLEKSVDLGFVNYPFLSRIDPFLEPVRGEERFRMLMSRVEREWEEFDAVH